MSRLTINSNIASLNAQRNFAGATKKLSESYTRLSSGLRINRAVDDAVGLSISESLKADTKIQNQGVRNLNDGISLLSIADGALGELTNITTRLRELAAQSANGTLSNVQRSALDKEAQSLSKEFNRIARSTEYNGMKLFDGDFGQLSLAAGGGSESLIVQGLGGAIGDGTFRGATTYVTGGASWRIHGNDFNGDGVVDLISHEIFSYGVGVSLGYGDGTFSPFFSYLASPNSDTWASTSADFNGDGNMDLVVGTRLGANILFGNGDGSFSNYITIGYGTDELRVVETADLNNDGKLDLIFGQSSNGVIIALGNGDGSFSAFKTFATDNLPADLRISDFNGDGNLDIATVNQFGGTVSILKGMGNGDFDATVNIVGGGRGIEVGDFDNDGLIDIATTSTGDTLNLIFGNGDMTFKARVSHHFDNIETLKSGDFNGDGIIDLVADLGPSGGIQILFGNGNGTFARQGTFSSGSAGSTQYVLTADLNNDGVTDVMSSNYYSSASFSIYLANSKDGVSALTLFSLATQQDAKTSMTYLENVLTRLSKQRGQIGAFEARIGVAINNLQASALNYQDANSRITDTDVAEEAAKLIASQVIQQAAARVLAQANQQPQIVLQLLKGF